MPVRPARTRDIAKSSSSIAPHSTYNDATRVLVIQVERPSVPAGPVLIRRSAPRLWCQLVGLGSQPDSRSAFQWFRVPRKDYLATAVDRLGPIEDRDGLHAERSKSPQRLRRSSCRRRRCGRVQAAPPTAPAAHERLEVQDEPDTPLTLSTRGLAPVQVSLRGSGV